MWFALIVFENTNTRSFFRGLIGAIEVQRNHCSASNRFVADSKILSWLSLTGSWFLNLEKLRIHLKQSFERILEIGEKSLWRGTNTSNAAVPLWFQRDPAKALGFFYYWFLVITPFMLEGPKFLCSCLWHWRLPSVLCSPRTTLLKTVRLTHFQIGCIRDVFCICPFLKTLLEDPKVSQSHVQHILCVSSVYYAENHTENSFSRSFCCHSGS